MSLSPSSKSHLPPHSFDGSTGLTPSSNAFPSFEHSLAGAPSTYTGFHGALDANQLLSPRMQTGTFQYPPGGSNSNLSDGQSPTSAPVHRMSVSSSGPFGQQLRNGSIDGSDPTSPGSVRGQGSMFGDSGGSMPPMSAGHISAIQPDADDPDNKGGDSKLDPAPAWAELKTKAGKERKRLPLACIACRRKKIRCSGEKPACKHCLRSRIPCVYKVTTRKAAPRTDYMAMLDKRLKRMEERVIRIVPKEDQGRISTIGRAVVKPAIPGLPPKPANEKKRAADAAFGEDLDDWSKHRPTASKSSNAASAAVQAARSRTEDHEENRLLQEGKESLPSRELQLHLAEVYFDFVYGQSYHLLHKPSFMRKLEAGKVPPVLILAVCAISARFSSHPEVRTEPAFLRGENWASAAREIALKRYDAPNITILIVYLILGLHEFGTCQGGRSWMLGGMAQRMAYALQLHKDLDHEAGARGKDAYPELTFTDREIRRRTMWACFMMDRFNSSGTERPIFVNEQFIQAQLPIKEHYFNFEISGITENLEGTISETIMPDTGQVTDARDNMGVAAHMTRGVAIWGRLIRYMNLGGKERDEHPMWSEKSGFNELRRVVRDWKSSLPSSLQWTTENLQNHASERIANQFIFLHMIYSQTMLFLHRFALPSPGSRSSGAKDMPQPFVTECGRSALDAANQISLLVNEAMDHRVVAPFAGYCAFFSSTVHIHGVFSKNPALEASSKQNLAVNVKYLTRMKKHWGMFHFVTENLKDLYRRHADAATRGPRQSHTPNGKPQDGIFQYGDWFDRYPNGVSGTDYEEPVAEVKKEPGADAVLGQKSDLQSVEEFFSKLSPPSRAAQQKKTTRKKRTKSELQAPQIGAAASNSVQQPGQQQQVHHQQQLQQQPSQSPANISQLTSGQLHQSRPAQQLPFTSQQQNPQLLHDMALLQAQQQRQQQAQQQQQQHHHHDQQQQQYPGIMSQLDRDMVMSSYAGLDHQPNLGSVDAGGNPFEIDLNAFHFGAGAGAGSGLWDQSSAWFMPFNMEPPNTLMDDGGLFSGGAGFDMTGLFGDFDGGLEPSLAPGPDQPFDGNE